MDKIPECCGSPVKIFQIGKGLVNEGEWICICINCWEGTSPYPTREEAIKAWEEEYV